MKSLLRRFLNDETKIKEVLDALSKEQVSNDITDAEYEMRVVKSNTRDQNQHLIDYMIILDRNINMKKEFLKTSAISSRITVAGRNRSSGGGGGVMDVRWWLVGDEDQGKIERGVDWGRRMTI
ncbi:unnamed protein product [Lactuca virosa]|uniref:Uncharacterized protein n=1 Tax=Lactuca virosa TaxID=75947 RepID=A0AAU9P3T0_9ASTR|nr:unnamed protein product [Lactuca virosa]